MADQEYIISIPVDVTDRTEPGATNAQKKIDRMTKDVYKFKGEVSGVSGSLGRMGSIANRIFTGMGKAVHVALAPIRLLRRSLLSLPGLIAGSAGFLGLVKAPIDLADNLASAKAGFETMLKSGKAATQMMKDIQQFAIKTPFETMEVVTQAQRMLTMGWGKNDIFKDMMRIGDAAAGIGKGQEGMARIVTALTQIRSKGKLSAEEINQLAEAGIRARDYIAKGLGVSTPQAMKMIEKGAVGADRAIEMILKGMEEYKGMMDKMANRTVGGLWSQIKDVLSVNLFTRWGQGLQKGAIKGMDSFNKFLGDNIDTLERWGDHLEKLGESFSTFLVGGIDKFVRRLDGAFKSDAWRKADTFSKKFKVLWDEVIVKPFGQWWNSGGEKQVAQIAEGMGKMLGGTMAGFVNTALGIASDTKSTDPFVNAGTTAGKKFFEGFLEAIQPAKLAARIAEGIPKMVGGTVVDAAQGKFDWGKIAGMGALAFLFRKPLGKLFGGLLGKTKGMVPTVAGGMGGMAAAEEVMAAPTKQLLDRFGNPIVRETLKAAPKKSGVFGWLKNKTSRLSKFSPGAGDTMKALMPAILLNIPSFIEAEGREKLRVAGRALAETSGERLGVGLGGKLAGKMLGRSMGRGGKFLWGAGGYSVIGELYDRALTWADDKWGQGKRDRNQKIRDKRAIGALELQKQFFPEVYKTLNPAAALGKTAPAKIAIEVKDSSSIVINASATAEDVMKVLRANKGQAANEMANKIADLLGQNFGNMPVFNPTK
jgi:tape measure domain-containing protein